MHQLIYLLASMRKLTMENSMTDETNVETNENKDAANYAENQQAENESTECKECNTHVDTIEDTRMDLEIANEEISNLKGELETAKNQPTTEPSEELEIANAKVAKLLSIVNLECGDLERMRAGTVQKMQMAEFYKSFPEMK